MQYEPGAPVTAPQSVSDVQRLQIFEEQIGLLLVDEQSLFNRHSTH